MTIAVVPIRSDSSTCVSALPTPSRSPANLLDTRIRATRQRRRCTPSVRSFSTPRGQHVLAKYYRPKIILASPRIHRHPWMNISLYAVSAFLILDTEGQRNVSLYTVSAFLILDTESQLNVSLYTVSAFLILDTEGPAHPRKVLPSQKSPQWRDQGSADTERARIRKRALAENEEGKRCRPFPCSLAAT